MPPVIDPWLEADQFGPPLVDFVPHFEDEELEDSLDIHPGLSPEVVVAEGGVVRPAAPELPPAEPEPEGPEVLQFEDGGSITLDKEKGQWKAVLDPGNGANPEVFWGKNKNQLVTNVLTAKLNATKKIRELNQKIKLNRAPAVPVTPPPTPTSRELTADDIFQIKTQLDSNPGLAFETYFQKATGLSISQLVELAQRGANADYNLTAETVNSKFIARNPDYYGDPNFKNFSLLVKYLAKYKLGKTATDANADTIFNELLATGNYTVENLEEAFEDLSSDGLLVKAPKPPKATTPPVADQPDPPPAPRPDERIVRTETRPRAALGIRPSDVTPVAAPTPKALSVEELDSLPDDEIAKLMAGVHRQRALARRSN